MMTEEKLLFLYESNLETVCRDLTVKGLSKKIISKRLNKDGLNIITPIKKVPEWKRFLSVLLGTWFSVLLIIGAMISFLIYFLETTPKDRSNVDQLLISRYLMVWFYYLLFS